MAEKIGVFGGSFNPVHNGHLILAEQIREIAGLDKVIFVPAHVSPFKIGADQPSGEDRLNMVKLSIEGAPGMEVSDFEILREGPSYTYDTLMHFKEVFGENAQVFFLLGTDTLEKLEYWKKGPELIENFGFISIYRKGLDKTVIDGICAGLKVKYPTCDIRCFETPELEISSSDLRERLRFGQSIKFLTPDCVIDYINEHGLYQSLTRTLGEFVRNNVKPSRYAHTIQVVKKAREFGEFYGVDIEKLEIAAIFHDAYRDAGNLEHGPQAAEHLEKDFGITDPDILNAIRYHTTCRAGASPVEMVLKLADMLEDTRTYREAAVIRARLTGDIYADMLDVMYRIKRYTLSKGPDKFSPESQECIDWLESIKKKNEEYR